MLGQVEGSDIAPHLLDMECQKAGSGADIEHALILETVAAEIIPDICTEIPFSLDRRMSGDVHRVIKIAILDIGDEALFGKWTGCHYRCLMETSESRTRSKSASLRIYSVMGWMIRCG